MYTGCPVQYALQYIGGKWQIGILSHLGKAGPLRFQAIRDRLPGLTEKVLTQNLKFFESKGIITREVFEGIPLKVQYRLTEDGLGLIPVIEHIIRWGYSHLQDEKVSRDMGLTPLSAIAEMEQLVASEGD